MARRRNNRASRYEESNSKKKKDFDLVDVGAIWEKDSKDGSLFLSVNIDTEKLADFMDDQGLEFGKDKVNFLAFTNKFKEKDGPKAPDYQLLASPPKERR
ncbi:MAG: hypothetical protein DRN27_05280 [Thermoplasmata archaeon]|nr:MAG: hypothetical protein DRN27_05280 [Thermoplasmata archaeon]